MNTKLILRILWWSWEKNQNSIIKICPMLVNNCFLFSSKAYMYIAFVPRKKGCNPDHWLVFMMQVKVKNDN